MAHRHSVYDSDAHFLIDPFSRTIKNSSATKTSIVQYDHDSERFTFEMPRYIEGHDMSKCDIVEVHYCNINSSSRATTLGAYDVEDLQLSPESEEVVIFSWLISGNATQHVGSLVFSLRFVCLTGETIDYQWNTTTFSGITVLSCIYEGKPIIEQFGDLQTLLDSKQDKLGWMTEEDVDAMFDGSYEGTEDEGPEATYDYFTVDGENLIIVGQ